MQSNPARNSDFRRLLELSDGTTVMRALSLVLPKDDGDDGDSPHDDPPDSTALMLTDGVIGVAEASCTAP